MYKRCPNCAHGQYVPDKETVIVEWAREIPPTYGGETEEEITKIMLAGLFYTASRLVETWDFDGVQFRDFDKITLAVQKSGWDEEFVLRLTKLTEPEEE